MQNIGQRQTGGDPKGHPLFYKKYLNDYSSFIMSMASVLEPTTMSW